jgi:hypothetical protein|nr:MAG TPA: hypothetical protein [Caudoviricetes sp.]
MFHRRKRNPRTMALDVAKEIGRRGLPAKVEAVTVMSAAGNVRRCAVVIPGRGVAVINNDLSIIVVSSNKPLPWNLEFKCENTEAAAENILRNLPLP